MGYKEEISIDFDKIVLSSDEQEALNLLQESNLSMDDSAKPVLSRLIHLGFAEAYPIWGSLKRGVLITDLGRDYLMYLSDSKQRKKTESRRYWITTAIAVAALIKSFLPEIRAVLELLWKLLTR